MLPRTRTRMLLSTKMWQFWAQFSIQQSSARSSRSVVVSTWDFESQNLGSNPSESKVFLPVCAKDCVVCVRWIMISLSRQRPLQRIYCSPFTNNSRVGDAHGAMEFLAWGWSPTYFSTNSRVGRAHAVLTQPVPSPSGDRLQLHSTPRCEFMCSGPPKGALRCGSGHSHNLEK